MTTIPSTTAPRDRRPERTDRSRDTIPAAADSVTELWAARLITFETAQAHDRGDDLKSLHARCSMAKLYASETSKRAADQAVQIHGGYGFIEDYPVARYWRDVKINEIGEGTSEVQRILIARTLGL